MFSLYGLTGPVFTGTLEQLGDVRQTSRVRPVRRVADSEMRGARVEALRSYEAADHADLERGPLYQAAQIMSRAVIVIPVDATVADAWATLREQHIHQAPVMQGGDRLVGMVSERALLTAFAAAGADLPGVLGRRVGDIMTSPVVAVDPETDIRRVVRVMLDYGVDGVPVVNASRVLVGFISRTDILGAVVTDPPLSLWR